MKKVFKKSVTDYRITVLIPDRYICYCKTVAPEIGEGQELNYSYVHINAHAGFRAHFIFPS